LPGLRHGARPAAASAGVPAMAAGAGPAGDLWSGAVTAVVAAGAGRQSPANPGVHVAGAGQRAALALGAGWPAQPAAAFPGQLRRRAWLTSTWLRPRHGVPNC